MRTLAAELSDTSDPRPPSADGCTGCGTSGRSASCSCVTARDGAGRARGEPGVTLESVVRTTGAVVANRRPRAASSCRRSDGSGRRGRARPAVPVNRSGQALPRGDPRQPHDHAAQPADPFDIQSAKHDLAAFADHLRSEGFTEIKTRSSSARAPRGTGLFPVEYFDGKVYLTQSPQLYKQAMVASASSGLRDRPAYRAEKHDTPRHINEFVSLDVEMAWVESEQDLMDLETRILATLFTRVRERNAKDLEAWKASFRAEAAAAFRACRTTRPARSWRRRRDARSTRSRRGERTLCEWALRTRYRGSVRVRLPRKSRPFYTLPAEGNRTHAFDLMFRARDHLGRHADQPLRRHRREREGVRPRDGRPLGLSHDLQVRVPAARRFAIGLERFTQKLLGLASVKEASLFPRDRKRMRP